MEEKECYAYLTKNGEGIILKFSPKKMKDLLNESKLLAPKERMYGGTFRYANYRRNVYSGTPPRRVVEDILLKGENSKNIDGTDIYSCSFNNVQKRTWNTQTEYISFDYEYYTYIYPRITNILFLILEKSSSLTNLGKKIERLELLEELEEFLLKDEEQIKGFVEKSNYFNEKKMKDFIKDVKDSIEYCDYDIPNDFLTNSETLSAFLFVQKQQNHLSQFKPFSEYFEKPGDKLIKKNNC